MWKLASVIALLCAAYANSIGIEMNNDVGNVGKGNTSRLMDFHDRRLSFILQKKTETTTTSKQPSGSHCSTPDFRTGNCVALHGCPYLLKSSDALEKDEIFEAYMLQSNANCDYEPKTFCCPVSPPRSKSKLLVPSDGCGVSKIVHNRIVGGVEAKIGGWPWVALVGYIDNTTKVSFNCGGSIITSRHVLTAAHCISDDLYNVRLGEHDLSTTTETLSIDIVVARAIVYHGYDPESLQNDLAILVLSKEILFTPKIAPVCFPFNSPQRSQSFVGESPFVIGWGRLKETDAGKPFRTLQLQEVQVPIVSNAECKAAIESDEQFSSDYPDVIIADATLCAFLKEGGKDHCFGDSGGPFMIALQNDGKLNYYQIGIVSWGVGCARPNLPGAYSRVQKFTDWIKWIVENT